MTTKRIKDLSVEATSSTLTDNDYAVVDSGDNGTRKTKLSALATWIHNKWASFVHACTAITSFADDDTISVSNPTDGTRKMSKDTLLTLTSQNSLAGPPNRNSLFVSDFISKEYKFNLTGYISSISGNVSSDANGRYTDYIPVKNGDRFFIASSISSGGASIACYDESKNYISASSVAGNYNSVFTVPSGVSFIRCSYYNPAANTTAICRFVSLFAENLNNVAQDVKNGMSEYLLSDEFKDSVISEAVNGYILWNGMALIIPNSTDPKMTDFIPVREGQIFSIKASITSAAALVAAYDSSLSYIQNKSIQGSGTVQKEYIVPSGVSYIVVSHYGAGDFVVTRKKIQSLTPFQDLETRGGLHSDSSFTFDLHGYLATNGTFLSEVSARCTDFIPVKAGEKYRICCFITDSGNSICCYDEQKSFIAASSVTGYYNGLFVIPDGVSYIRCSFYGLQNSEVLVRVSDSLYPNCNKKNILVFGDSISDCTNITVSGGVTTAYVYRTIYCETPNYGNVRYAFWPTLMRDIFNANELRCYAKSGATYRNQNGGQFRQSLREQVDLAIADRLNTGGAFSVNDFTPDIVIFALGTNDLGVTEFDADSALAKVVWEDDPIQVDYDATVAALDLSKAMDAALYAYLTIRKYWPMALGIVVAPIQRMSIDVYGSTFAENLAKVAKYCGFVFANGADLSNISRFSNVSGTNGSSLIDGLHPNPIGQNMMARMMISLVASNYCDFSLFNNSNFKF